MSLPIGILLVGYPLWWALGFGGLIVVVLAVPMAVILWRRRPLLLPRGFGLWSLILVGYLASATMLGATPAGTHGDLRAGRIAGYLMRLALYLALLIVVLYIGNLTERELPRLALIRMLGVLFLVTVAGGLLGVLAPGFEYTAPIERLLPDWIGGNSFVRNLIHPTAAQTQYVLGYAAPRPEAPFEWANAWGSNVSVLLVWFTVGWWVYGGTRRRVIAVAVVALAAIPVVHSLNRGLWIALAFSAVYLVLRLARQRKALGVAVLTACLTLGGAVFLITPLHAIVAQRIESPHSNEVRGHTVTRTLEAALASPVLGYGNTRNAVGNHRSATTAKTSWCAECGHPPLGSDGQLWLLLMTQGFIGAGLYVAFFAGAVRRYRRDTSPVGVAGTLIMILVLFYMFVYDGLVTPLILYLISFALLWRNAMETTDI
ncbi:O-antigen ligase family protein [Rhizohabitans arisaemae]|uniref:O-antigen ligase family protein n=1 Tax=Rhizohabitans arisaemae TaxID=2720610 RepID=UPI0024B1A624|nr:O-antigen ligase family protein [Rhizohabitans arisaemae]